MMAEQTDDMLLEKVQAGDADAWRTLVASWTPRVFGLLVRQCGDRELSEELTQEVFVKLVMSLQKGTYRHQGSLGAWLMQVGMNALRDEMRRRKRQARPVDMQASGRTEELAGTGAVQWQQYQWRQSKDVLRPDELVSRKEEADQVLAVVESMSENDRQILYMRHTAGLSFAEIAEALEQPLGTVLARAHRALSKLRKQLAEQTAGGQAS